MVNSSISINSALCLPASDVEALNKGRMIAALSRTFVNTVQYFALCPVEELKNNSVISINSWAKLEFCKVYHDSQEVDKLAQLTIWSNKELQRILQERFKIFLLCLRVFQVNQPVEIPAEYVSQSKIGSFIKLPNLLSMIDTTPVLSDDFFSQRKQQLTALEPPLHPELEELQEKVAQLVEDEDVKDLDQYIQSFLGWSNKLYFKRNKSKFIRVNEIVSLGDRSIEEEKGKKNNWQAGTDFENVVQDSLRFLGFKVEEEHRGGAGGLDLFCSSPYSLVAECKAGKSIPDRAVEQLARIGKRHLKQDYMRAVRLIIGSGKPTKQLQESAITSEVSIISAMILQKLAKFHSRYSIDLIELKEKYLLVGQTDNKIQEYLDKAQCDIKLRFQVVQAVKELFEKDKQGSFSAAEIRIQYNNRYAPYLSSEELVKELLVELSSPLIGYLGRRKGSDGSDRFYFLRDMPEVDHTDDASIL